MLVKTEIIFVGSLFKDFQVRENFLLIRNARGKTSFSKGHTCGKTSGRIDNTRKNNRGNKSLSEKAAYPITSLAASAFEYKTILPSCN